MEIKTVKMNLDTLMSNLKYAQTFEDENYKNKLSTLLQKSLLKDYREIIMFLINHCVWLEQESFYNI